MGRIDAILRRTAAKLGTLSLASLVFSVAPALAEDGRIGTAGAAAALPAELDRAGWRLLTLPGKSETRFTEYAPGSIGISADNAVAFLYRPVATDMGPKHRLGWRWRVDEAVPGTDLSRAGADDRSLAVHLVFPIAGDQLSFWKRIGLELSRAFAPPLAGNVLTYVWGGTQAKGTILTNPYLDLRGKIIVLRSANEPSGRWFMEQIDFVADFRQAFGYDPPAPAFVAISADSDDTGSHGRGVIADLLFAS